MTEENLTAARADDFTAKKVEEVPILRPGLIASETLSSELESIGRYNGWAKTVNAVSSAGICLIAQNAADATRCNRGTVQSKDIVRNLRRRVAREMRCKDKFDGGALLLNDLDALAATGEVDKAVPERRLAANLALAAQKTLADVFDAVGCLVRLILRNGELEIEHKAAIGRRRIVIFLRADPLHVMLVEDGLNFVKVGNVAKPAVETFEQDDVDAIGADVIKKALQLLAARNGLAGGATLIGIDPDDEVVVLIGILGKIVLLLSEREAVPGLLFGADTDIDGCSYHKNHLINVKNHGTSRTGAAIRAIIIDKAALCLLLQASASGASRERRSFTSQLTLSARGAGGEWLERPPNILYISFLSDFWSTAKVFSPEKGGLTGPLFSCT